jgi:5-formyltetrahydrofolate cyclo-ligase
MTSTHDIRNRALTARRAMDDEERIVASSVITSKFTSSHLFMSAHSIACYMPMKDEVDSRAVFERGWRSNKHMFVPVTLDDGSMYFCEVLRETELKRNQFGVFEPTSGTIYSPRFLDVVIAPLVAFDAHHNRIGMGGGYFDRCFSYLRHRRHWFQPKLIGLAFHCQKVEKITPNPWDIPLYCVYDEME